MKVGTQPNYNRKTNEIVFGISICIDGGRRYCKYPIGHQNYKTIGEAYEAKKRIEQQCQNGAHLEYGPDGSIGINKAEYVRVIE